MPAPLTSGEAHPLAVQAMTALTPPSRARLAWQDDFRGSHLNLRWRWLRPRGEGAGTAGWSLGRPGLMLATEDADLYIDRNTASVLQAALPAGDYRVELELRLDAPEDCCATAVQAGLVVMRDDDNYVKLVEMAREGLRQVEFAKEMAPVAQYYPRYGNTLAGTPGPTTWLRLDVHRGQGQERYTAYSSQDGRSWVGGGTWVHRLGSEARLGLVAMGGAGRRATFVRVAVSTLWP
jgi:arabinan endo-1,5-alpha-L-arabinosidase